MIKHRTKVFSIWKPVKLENKLSAPSIQWCNRHRIKTIYIPVQKGRTGRKKKKRVIDAKLFQKPAKLFVWRPTNNPLWLCTLIYSSIYVKGSTVFHMCSLLAFYCLENCGGQRDFFHFCLLSTPFIPSWQYFCWYEILNNLMDFLCMSLGFIPLEK